MVKLKRGKTGKGGSKMTKSFIAIGIPATLLVLVIVVSLIPRGPDVYPLPNVQFKEQHWMTYVPAGSSLVKFYNFTRIVSSPGAQYAIQNNTLVYVYGLNYKVNVDQALYTFEVFLGSSEVVDVFALQPAAYQSFYSLVTSTFPSQQFGGYTFFPYRINSSAVIRAFAYFRDGLIFQSTGGPSAYKSVTSLLTAHDANRTDFFSTQERHAEYYLASTTERKMMGFSVLPNTTAGGTHEWVTAVYDGNSTIDLANFYAYPTQHNATQLYQSAVTEILSPNYARSYIIGNFLAQTRSYPWSQARTPMNSL